MTKLPPRAGGLRLIRVAIIALVFGVALNSVGVAVTFKLNADRVDQINQERQRNTAAGCVRESGQNERIVRFLRARGATAESLADARRFFPVLSDAECHTRARERVAPTN